MIRTISEETIKMLKRKGGISFKCRSFGEQQYPVTVRVESSKNLLLPTLLLSHMLQTELSQQEREKEDKACHNFSIPLTVVSFQSVVP